MKTREEMLELLSEYIEHLIGSEVMKSKDTAGVEKLMRLYFEQLDIMPTEDELELSRRIDEFISKAQSGEVKK